MKPDLLTRIDETTGPRQVLIGEPARELLDSLTDSAAGPWVVPGHDTDERVTHDDLYSHWIQARHKAGIVAHTRLHDLRTAHPSQAVTKRASLHVSGHLVGHRRTSTTKRYFHVDYSALSQATKRGPAAS